MTKKFDNLAADGKEKAIRRGFSVPDGAVNIGWAKAPKLNPVNNIVIIDTSKVVSENQNISSKRKKLAFANALGVLEDENGNQIWEEEYPIISDVFLLDENEVDESDYIDDTILPYTHISRYFHIDYFGLAYSSLSQYNGFGIKVINKNGLDYVDENGKKKYKIYLIQPKDINFPANSQESAYRVYAFLDMNVLADELYLAYDKVELNTAGGVKDQEIGYKELINARTYFRYAPEESDIIDQSNLNQKIYSSKPYSLKQQVLGLPQPNFTGWKYFVPRKAIPDPRIFQLFRWRLACEITQPTVPENTGSNLASVTTATIRVGVVIPAGGNHFSTRANYFFHEMNQSDYNFSCIQFINPLKTPNFVANTADQKNASYWHVDISTVSAEDLKKFDILLWAPSADSVDISAYSAKINYFVEQLGGTFIFETSSLTNFTNIPDITFSTSLTSTLINPAATTYTTASTLRLYDAIPDITTDTFNTLGMWKKWPPNVADILNNYTDIGSILASADVIAGWVLDDGEKAKLSGYMDITNTKFQYISNYGMQTYSPVLEAKDETSTYRKTVVHRKFQSGGNIFVSTSCLFEDHLFEVAGDMASRSLQIASIDELDPAYRTMFKEMVSSQAVEGEMKLRLNAILFSTLNKPSTISYTQPTQSVTVFGDWDSSWVINPTNGVLSEFEKTKYNFSFLPTIDYAQPTWQRILSDKTAKKIIQDKIYQLDPSHQNKILNTFEGAKKRFFIIVTNPNVQVFTPDFISDDTIPTAWTNMYSPSFTMPTHIGSYAVRDEMITGTPVGESKRIYPPKPYQLQANVSYMNSSTIQGSVTATVSLRGTCLRYVTRPPTTTTRQEWVPPGPNTIADVVLHWNTDGANRFENGYVGHTYFRQGEYPKPIGMDTWTSANYGLANNWPYPGMNGKLAKGSQGVMVLLAQKMLNQLMFFGAMPGGVPGTFQGLLLENGIYNTATYNAVLRLQQFVGAKYQDGIIDAETWSLLAYRQIGISNIPGWWDATGDEFLKANVLGAKDGMMLNSISDDNINNKYMTQSLYSGGPTTISETFQIKFNEKFPVYKVAVMPFCSGMATNDLVIDWVDTSPMHTTLAGYDFSQGSPGDIAGMHGGDGQWINIAIIPWIITDSLIFRATQSGPAGWGTARCIGIRDVAVYGTKSFPGAPGYYRDVTVTVPGSVYTETVGFDYQINLGFDAGVPVKIAAQQALNNAINSIAPNGEMISDVQWDITSLSITPTDIGNSFSTQFSSDGGVSFPNLLTLIYQGYNHTLSAEVFVNGPMIGNGSNTYWTKDRLNALDPYSRNNGWIKNGEGLKLICKSDGTPYGFPAALPNQVTTLTHFARYKLNAFDTDQTLYYGFYDIAKDEFITNSYGQPEISYYDYIRRGPQNIFISVMTTYELYTSDNISGGYSITRPFKWGMPVYGVTSGLQSKIQIESISPDLGNGDIWPIPIKCGSFANSIQLKARDSGSFTGYLKDYQGSTVRAFYSVPEATNGPWSSLYGRPYVDVKAEIPLIIDDYTIKIRQAPILIAQTPTNNPSAADPWFPIFTVYIRDTLTSQWYSVDFTNIQDYNIWDGTITLKTSLPNNDPRLVKVNYTSNRNVFYMKVDGTTRINLNPYINNRSDWTNKPLYVYILPEYVLDFNNILISSSVQTRTIHVTTDSSIFNSNQVIYDPTAVLLGIIYISSAADINQLALLDTRKRGGGVSTAYDNNDIIHEQSESESYWDIIPNTTTSYQKGGYIIIRLPSSLKDDFTLDQIKAVIKRNLTVGVGYEIQDLQGNRWSQ